MFLEVRLAEVRIDEVRSAGVIFADVHLSFVKGLENVKHRGPSTIGINTIYRSRGRFRKDFYVYLGGLYKVGEGKRRAPVCPNCSGSEGEAADRPNCRAES